MPALDVRAVMMDLYETEFGIYDHVTPGPKHPFASVLHHPKEEYYYNSPLKEVIEEFGVYNLGELYNLSLTEYLRLPTPMLELLRRTKDDILKKREALVRIAEDKIAKERQREKEKPFPKRKR